MNDVQLNASERDDLRYILARWDGAAERLLGGIEENRLTGWTFFFAPAKCGCGYGLGAGEEVAAQKEAAQRRTAVQRRRTPIEDYLNLHRDHEHLAAFGMPGVSLDARNELKAEIIAWLAEQGQHPEPSPRNTTETPELVYALAR